MKQKENGLNERKNGRRPLLEVYLWCLSSKPAACLIVTSRRAGRTQENPSGTLLLIRCRPGLEATR